MFQKMICARSARARSARRARAQRRAAAQGAAKRRAAPPAAGERRRRHKGHFSARHFPPMIDWRWLFSEKSARNRIDDAYTDAQHAPCDYCVISRVVHANCAVCVTSRACISSIRNTTPSHCGGTGRRRVYDSAGRARQSRSRPPRSLVDGRTGMAKDAK